MALDPFHDYEIPIAGIPDSDTEKTAVQFIKRTSLVTAPSGVGSNTWSCQVATLPTLLSTRVNECHNREPSNLLPSFDTTYDEHIGTITITSAVEIPALEELWPGVDSSKSVYTTANSFRREGISPTDEGNTESMMKIIGGGFEVTDVSNYTVKQGSVTVGSIPQGYSVSGPGVIYAGSESTSSAITNCRICRSPPQTAAQAGLVSNSRTWEAQDGVYVPMRLDTSSWSGFEPQAQQAFCVCTGDAITELSPQRHYHAETGLTVAYSQSSGRGTPSLNMNITTDRAAHLETSYAHFSGLAPDAVLRVVSIFIVEVAPTAANPTLTSMASSSALYEPKALELYSKMLCALPPGTKVGNNASGDWWRTVLRSAGMVASTLAPIIPNPAVKAVVGSSGALLQTLPAGKKPLTSRPEKPKKKVLTKRN